MKDWATATAGTYHLLDVVGGTERIVLVAGVDVVHVAGVLVATEVGDRREGGGPRRGGDEGIGGGNHGRRQRRGGRTLDGEAGTVAAVVVAVGIGTRLGLKLLAGVALGHGSGLAFLERGTGTILADIGIGLVGSIAVERVAEGAALAGGIILILILMVIHGSSEVVSGCCWMQLLIGDRSPGAFDSIDECEL